MRGGQGTGGEHLGTEWVLLQLLEVGLSLTASSALGAIFPGTSGEYRQVATRAFTSGQTFPNFVRDLMFPSSWNWHVPDGLFLELDRHGVVATDKAGQRSINVHQYLKKAGLQC